jgi:hypothetical protein
MLGGYLGPVRIELFGDNHRERREHALPHFQVPHGDDDATVGSNMDERSRRQRGDWFAPLRRRKIYVETQQQSACDGG